MNRRYPGKTTPKLQPFPSTCWCDRQGNGNEPYKPSNRWFPGNPNGSTPCLIPYRSKSIDPGQRGLSPALAQDGVGGGCRCCPLEAGAPPQGAAPGLCPVRGVAFSRGPAKMTVSFWVSGGRILKLETFWEAMDFSYSTAATLLFRGVLSNPGGAGP